MAGEIATAYVRIRPQMASFRSETESGVKGAFSNIGKIVGGAFAAVGAFEFGKHIVEEASGQQAAFAVLDRTIKNVGASTRGFGDDLESVLAKEARLKGFSDTQLASGFTQLVSVTHNSQKAFKDLVIAEDLARARHKDLTVASLALARAEQGSTTTLSRFGIKVPQVTTAVDALKKSHDQAVASGAKFTGQTKIEYQALLEQAKASDKAATRVEALRLVQERFGGVASSFATSAAGEFARFHENVNQLEIAIGKGLLPGLAGAAAGINKYIGELSTSEGVQNAVHGGARDLGQAFGVFKNVVEAIGPPLLTVARGAEAVTHAIGVGPILAAVAAYKGVVFVVGKAAAAEQAYASVSAAGRASRAQETASADSQVGIFTRLNASLGGVAAARERDSAASTAHAAALERETAAAGGIAAASGGATGGISAMTAALEANTAAAAADAAAAEGLVTIYGPLGGILATVAPEAAAASAGLDALAASEVAAGAAGGVAAAGGLGAFVSGIGRLGLGAVGGPVGIAVLGIAALAGGIAYFATRASDADRAAKNLEGSIKDLANAQTTSRRSVLDLADARTGIQSDRVASAEARLNVETARHALTTSQAARGTVEYQRLLLNLRGAVAAYRQSQGQLNDDLFRYRQAQEDATKGTAASRAALASVSDSVDGLRAAIRREIIASNHPSAGHFGGILERIALTADQAAQVVSKFTGRLEAQIPALARESPLIAHNTQLLVDFANQVGRIPTRKETRVILSTPNLDATLQEIDAKLASIAPDAAAAGRLIGVAWGQGILAGIHGIAGNPLANAIKGFEGPLANVSTDIQKKVRAALATGIFTPAQIAKQFGITPAEVASIEKAASAAADRASSAAKKAAAAAAAKPKNIANIIPFKVQLELAGAVTPAQQRKALEDEIAALNQELSKNITESSRRAIELEKASAQAQLAGLASSIQQSGDTVAKTIQTANQAIAKSVADAKTNLDSIGAKLGASIDKFLGKGGVGGLDSAQTSAFTKLKSLISGGGSRLDIERAGSQLQADLAAGAKSPAKSAKDQIRALTDAFNRGDIGVKQFNRKITDLLKADKITYAQAGKLLGRSFEDGLRSQVTGLEKQASALAAVPKKFRGAGGSGDVIKIVRPLEVIQKENALIRAANDRHASAAAHQRERIIRASERTARAAEKTAAAAQGAAFVKQHMIPGPTSKKAKAAAKAGIRP